MKSLLPTWGWKARKTRIGLLSGCRLRPVRPHNWSQKPCTPVTRRTLMLVLATVSGHRCRVGKPMSFRKVRPESEAIGQSKVGMTMQRTAPFAVRYWDDVTGPASIAELLQRVLQARIDTAEVVCGLGTTVASVVAVFVRPAARKFLATSCYKSWLATSKSDLPMWSKDMLYPEASCSPNLALMPGSGRELQRACTPCMAVAPRIRFRFSDSCLVRIWNLEPPPDWQEYQRR